MLLPILILGTFIKGYSFNADSTRVDSTLNHFSSEIIEVKSFLNPIDFLDTTLAHVTLLDPQEDLFSPSFFAVNSGLYKFPIILDTEDYRWISKNLMLNYDKLIFVNDTTPTLNAEYDHGYASTHWFTSNFNRKVGHSIVHARFNRSASEPLYNNTRATRSNFALGAKIPFKKNYTMTMSYSRNKVFLSENGGIYNIDSIPSVKSFDVSTLQSNLNTAENNLFDYEASLLQKIKLLRWNNDSASKKEKAFLFNLHTSISENRYSFELSKQDIDSAFFLNTFLDSTQTFDSIGFKKIEFQPELELISGFEKNLKLGVTKQWHNKDVLNNSFAYLKSKFEIAEKPITIKAKYYFENYWNGNFNFSVNTNWDFKKTIEDARIIYATINTFISYGEELPSYLFMNYLGNHFSWRNEFNDIKRLKIKSTLNFPKASTKIDLEFQNIDNYIYFDALSTPMQTEEKISVGKVHFKNKLGKKWVELISGLGIQFTSSDLIRIPDFFCRNSLIFNFKYHHVPFSFGTTFNFFSKYNGLNYNPAIRHYILGREDVGGTPVFDWFIATRLGPADLYMKYDNSFYYLNRSLFIGENYPIYKSYLRFGLKWNLKN